MLHSHKLLPVVTLYIANRDVLPSPQRDRTGWCVHLSHPA
jgi:hypothetical protein